MCTSVSEPDPIPRREEPPRELKNWSQSPRHWSPDQLEVPRIWAYTPRQLFLSFLSPQIFVPSYPRGGECPPSTVPARDRTSGPPVSHPNAPEVTDLVSGFSILSTRQSLLKTPQGFSTISPERTFMLTSPATTFPNGFEFHARHPQVTEVTYFVAPPAVKAVMPSDSCRRLHNQTLLGCRLTRH
ncbi:hypothetical protein RRG08_045259 [Elysia crispata]|uniref:Uncharacterized protein n=1 Tax=Elysia crispata TaxID=231223 RepID=A0AAE1A1D3_9GAST|nr:hypothetical protein RRG08_045259 [Elysia crispata]